MHVREDAPLKTNRMSKLCCRDALPCKTPSRHINTCYTRQSVVCVRVCVCTCVRACVCVRARAGVRVLVCVFPNGKRRMRRVVCSTKWPGVNCCTACSESCFLCALSCVCCVLLHWISGRCVLDTDCCSSVCVVGCSSGVCWLVPTPLYLKQRQK